MEYIVKFLIPELPNSTGNYSKKFHTIENFINSKGGIVSGMTHNYKNEISSCLKYNDAVIVHDSDPISAFISGMALNSNLVVIGYISRGEIIKNNAFEFMCNYIGYGITAIKEMSYQFISEGKIDAGPQKRKTCRGLPCKKS